MKFGPFVCLPGQLLSTQATLEDWERYSAKIFDMQRHVPWWIGDMIMYGEAQFGDDVYQALPIDIDAEMCSRFAHISKAWPAEDRNPNVGWSHHAAVLRVNNKSVRRALLRKAADEQMDLIEFKKLIGSYK